MAQWWETLATLQKVFYYFAVPATVLLIIQTILTIIGLGSSNDIEAGADTDGDMDFDTGGDADFEAEFEGDFEAEFEGDFEAEFEGEFEGETMDIEDFDAGSDTMPGFKFFTVRGLIAFFCLMGWTGVTLSTGSMSAPLIVIISVAAGLVGMFLIGGMFYLITSLQSSGNVRKRNAIGKSGTVYIPIPPSRKGHGKINVQVQERLIEADAVTDSKITLKTGSEVRVIDITSTGVLVVEAVK